MVLTNLIKLLTIVSLVAFVGSEATDKIQVLSLGGNGMIGSAVLEDLIQSDQYHIVQVQYIVTLRNNVVTHNLVDVMSRVMSRVGRQLLLITLGGKFELAQRASSAAACNSIKHKTITVNLFQIFGATLPWVRIPATFAISVSLGWKSQSSTKGCSQKMNFPYLKKNI